MSVAWRAVVMVGSYPPALEGPGLTGTVGRLLTYTIGGQRFGRGRYNQPVRPLEREAFDTWDREKRRRLGWRAGLELCKRTNTGGWVLISRHWPHRLCWSWSIWLQPWRGRRKDGPLKLGAIYAFRSLTLDLLLFSARLVWQDYDDMVASRYKDEAPVVRYPWGGIGGGNLGRTPEESRTT